ncbi:MAG: SH3 domain-containing protein, partial [Candidatus Faecivicinus sp.]
MKEFRKLRTLTAILLAVILLISSVPAALASSFSAYVKSSSMSVYSDSSLSKKIGALEQYTVVTVSAYSGGVARISYGGASGYAKVSDMEAVDSVAIRANVNTSTRVYKKASASSSSASLPKGTQVNVIAIKGSWALIERSGVGGYTYVKYLTPVGQAATAEPTATPEPTAAPTVDTGKAIPAVVSAASVTVYKSANTSSTALGTLKKGASLNVIAVNGSWAYVERSGAYGYCKVSALTPASQAATAEPTATPEPTAAPTVDTGKAIPAVVTAASVTVYKSANTS